MHIPDHPLIRDIRAVFEPEPEQLLLVGGAVRDLMLGRPVADLDLLVAVPPDRFERLVTDLSEQLKLHPVRPTGFDAVVRLVSREHTVDLTRIDAGALAANLESRELTINAMALDVVTGTLIDPTGGRRDLADRLLRAPQADVFQADPVRLLRLFRFQVELGFAIDPDTRTRALAATPHLHRSAGERIREELFRLLAHDGAADTMTEIADPVMTELFPALAAIRPVPQNGYHHLDVFPHTLEVLRHTFLLNSLQTMIGCPDLELDREDRIALRLAALFHDTGKADTMARRPDGIITFKGHQYRSAELFRRDIEILKPVNRMVERVYMLIRRHMLFLNFMLNGIGPRSFRKLINLMREDSPLLALLAVADKLSARGPLAGGSIEQICRLAREFLDTWQQEGRTILNLPKLVDGHEVMEMMALEPSPEVGRILSAICERQLDDPAMTREDALRLLETWKRDRRP